MTPKKKNPNLLRQEEILEGQVHRVKGQDGKYECQS
jgi:hypothetical protein